MWIISLSLKDDATLNDGNYLPVSPSGDSYAAIFRQADFLRALVNSIGICSDRHVHRTRVRDDGRLRHRPTSTGKATIVAVSLLISMFPQIALVTPLFKIETALGLFDTWPGLIIPTSRSRCRWPSTPSRRSSRRSMGPGEGGQDGRRHAVPGVPAGHHAVGDAQGVHHAILVFIACWNDFLFASLTSTSAARTVPAAMSYFTGATTFEKPTGPIAAAAVVITIPLVIVVLLFQRRIVAGLTSGAVKG